MMSKPSRLWRKLGATQPIFTGWSETADDLAMNDEDIKSITITRGSSGATFGPQTHTLEVDTIRPYREHTDEPLHLDLTAHGAERIAALTGASTSTITPRYFGRIGRQIVDDYGGGYDLSKWHVSLYCSKWQSQLANSDRLGNQISGGSVHYLMDHFMNPSIDASFMPYMPPAVFTSPAGDYGTMINDYDLATAKIPFSSFAGSYLTAPGYYVQNTRTGADRVMTIDYRWNSATNQLGTALPLTRSQVLAPTQWDQPRQDTPGNHLVTWTGPSGARHKTVGPDPSDARIPVTEHDLSYIRYSDESQPVRLAASAYGAERNDKGYRLPSVTIDLLTLISSPVKADQIQAKQLVSMEMGDPVFLSGDWFRYLGGIVFATGIKETITADKWEIELSLAPSYETTGYTTPDVPARAWDSARIAWDTETREWNEA